MNLEDEEELTKQTISNTEEDWNNLCLRDFSYNNRVHLNILYGLFNEADIFQRDNFKKICNNSNKLCLCSISATAYLILKIKLYQIVYNFFGILNMSLLYLNITQYII